MFCAHRVGGVLIDLKNPRRATPCHARVHTHPLFCHLCLDIAMLVGWLVLTVCCATLQHCVTARGHRLPGTYRPGQRKPAGTARSPAQFSPAEQPAAYGARVLAYRPAAPGPRGLPESKRELRALHAQYEANARSAVGSRRSRCSTIQHKQ